jgi:molybdopterin-guanine dinucleotide biosynthesis protein A
MNTKTVTGLILAGGRARRMEGQDKGLILLNGQTLIEHCIHVFAPQTSQLLISANRNIEQYRQFGYPVLQDTVGEFLGPLAGLLSAQQHLQPTLLNVVPCDAPYLAPNLVDRLLAAFLAGEDLAVIPHDGQRLQPLFGLYSQKALDSLIPYLDSGGRKVMTWVESLAPRIVDFSDQNKSFYNINSVAELAEIKTVFHNEESTASDPS